MPLSFHPFQIQDKTLFQHYLHDGGRLCEHAFANLFAWQQTFGNQWAECEGRLIVRSRTNAPGESSKYMLLPDVRTQHLSEILRRIQEDAGGHPFCPLDDDLRGIIRLWQDCFHDDETFIHAFLSRYYRPERAFLLRERGCVTAQCMLVACDSEVGRVGYLYAIATAEECRRQGLAAQVTKEAIAYARNHGLAAVALIPADDRLRRYYARFGFEAHPFPMRFTGDLDLGTGDATKDYPMILKLQDVRLTNGGLVCAPEE